MFHYSLGIVCVHASAFVHMSSFVQILHTKKPLAPLTWISPSVAPQPQCVCRHTVLCMCTSVLNFPKHLHWAVAMLQPPWAEAWGTDWARSNSGHEACPELFHAMRFMSCTTAATHNMNHNATLVTAEDMQRTRTHIDYNMQNQLQAKAFNRMSSASGYSEPCETGHQILHR